MIGEWEKLKHIGISEWTYQVDGGMGEEVNHRITEVKKAWGALKDVWIKRGTYLGRQK